MLPLIAILTFVSVTIVMRYALAPQVNPVRERILDKRASQRERDARLRESAFKRLLWPIAQRFGNLLASILPQNIVKSVERELIAANASMSLAMFMFIWFSLVVLMLLVLAYTAPHVETVRLIFFGLVVLSFGLLTPPGLLQRRARLRRKAIERSLPDGLDLLVTGMEAGLSADASFALVAEHYRDPLGETFTDYLRQVGLGRSRRETLDDLAHRSGVDDLIQLSGTIGQAMDVGSGIGGALRLQARELRARRRLRAQEAARKAPVWMVIPLALCFLPAMVAVIVVPSILNLVNFVSNGFGSGG